MWVMPTRFFSRRRGILEATFQLGEVISVLVVALCRAAGPLPGLRAVWSRHASDATAMTILCTGRAFERAQRLELEAYFNLTNCHRGRSTLRPAPSPPRQPHRSSRYDERKCTQWAQPRRPATQAGSVRTREASRQFKVMK
jgi:hypothetical protein